LGFESLSRSCLDQRRLSTSEDAFQDFSDDDPWVANGISIVTRQDGRIAGYVSVELWLG
jgi:hypothetical protein